MYNKALLWEVLKRIKVQESTEVWGDTRVAFHWIHTALAFHQKPQGTHWE